MPTNRTRGARGGLKLPRTPRLRGDGNQCASDTLADSREQKPKIFLTFLLFLGGGWGGSRQKMERKFLVLLRRFSLRKEHHYFITFGCSFLRPHGETRRFLSAFGVALISMASVTGCGNPKNMD